MDFKNIIGNENLRSLIGSHIRNKTLSHAYIIEGPKGSGKHTVVKEICKAIMCESPIPDLPCGVCRSCKRVDEGYNTDIFLLTKGDKASISVEDVRGMTSTLGYYPDDGDTKVYIIEEADKMTVQAQNALLLSLEEPPAYVVFLLITEDSTSLLETVRSRAQRLKTEVFSTDFTARWLRSQSAASGKSDEAVASAATVSRGSLGLALSTLASKDSKEASLSANASRLVELLCKGSRADTIIFASGIKYSRAEFEQFFDYSILAVRDILYAKYNGFSPAFYADSEIPRELSSKLKMTKLMHIYDALISAKDDITKHNAQTYAVMTTLAASAQ